MALPSWAPTLDRVGAHIPTRTRAIGVSNDYTGTFTADTQPTATQVGLLLEDACTWAAGGVGTPVAVEAYDLLTTAAALRCAYHVELAYPERDADVSVYDRFLTDADAALEQARAVNRANGGGTSLDATGEPVVLVAASFPDPPRWADTYLN